MVKAIIDTNLIIRFLVNDDPQKSAQVEKLLSGQDHTNMLPDLVVAEIIWVLISYYKVDKKDIILKVRALINLQAIKCDKKQLENALQVWERHNVAFIDAYLVALACSKDLILYSYDNNLDKIKFLHRQEP